MINNNNINNNNKWAHWDSNSGIVKWYWLSEVLAISITGMLQWTHDTRQACAKTGVQTPITHDGRACQMDGCWLNRCVC